MSSDKQQVITVRIRCIDMPTNFEGRNNVRLGIQNGKTVEDDQTLDAAELIFTCPLRVAPPVADGKPNFLGPYAHGKPAERFLYLCWGERTVNGWNGFGRIKIHLKDLSWSAVERAIASAIPLEVVVKLAGKEGKPVYASLGKEQVVWVLNLSHDFRKA